MTRILIIDDSDSFRAALREQLQKALPDAIVDSWDAVARGKPGPDFDWRRYDLLLLDDAPQPGASGFAWLAEFRARPNMPPTIILAETGGEDQAVRAMKAGAADYLSKASLSIERLARAIHEALAAHAPAPRPAMTQRLTQPLPLSARAATEPPIAIRGYRTFIEIARGGMSRVYLVTREADGLQLVLKVLEPRLLRDPEFAERFQREYRIIRRIQNEHVVTIFDQGIAGEHPYIAMELFTGGDLKARIDAGLNAMAALRILGQIARALDAVHGAGIVHRDLKPQNILFRDNGRLALVDFGLARELDATSTLTRDGIVLATPLYMSPEQCVGREHGPRGDLYSAGAIFHEMLTGRPPFQGENAAALVYQHVHAEAPRLPPSLAGYQAIVDRLLAKNPEDRFASARELFSYVVY